MSRYSTIPIIRNDEGKQYYRLVKYPNVPLNDSDQYILCSATDRYDKLALQFYGDPSLWWVISVANNATNQDSLFPPTGSYVRIPNNPVESIAAFNILNEPSI